MGRPVRIPRRRVCENDLPARKSTPSCTSQKTIVKTIEDICVAVIHAVKRIPETIANAARLRQQRVVLDELEAERLDRIRNPSKYRGK